MESINIPASLKSIGEYAFQSCSNLKDIYITDLEAWLNIEYGDDYCSHPDYYGTLHLLDANGNEITELVIPTGITAIPDKAFKNFTTLTSVIIPESVTSIGAYAFYNCTGLTNIVLPTKVTSIGYQAFYNCQNLKNVYFCSPTPPTMGGDIFCLTWDYEDFSIYVPEEAYDLYMNIDDGGYWQSYALDNIRTWKVK